jgi:hypothetical protein
VSVACRSVSLLLEIETGCGQLYAYPIDMRFSYRNWFPWFSWFLCLTPSRSALVREFGIDVIIRDLKTPYQGPKDSLICFKNHVQRRKTVSLVRPLVPQRHGLQLHLFMRSSHTIRIRDRCRLWAILVLGMRKEVLRPVHESDYRPAEIRRKRFARRDLLYRRRGIHEGGLLCGRTQLTLSSSLGFLDYSNSYGPSG